MFEKSEGNALIVLILDPSLISLEKSVIKEKDFNDYISFFYQDLYDEELIDKLSEKAKQPSVKILAKNFSVF